LLERIVVSPWYWVVEMVRCRGSTFATGNNCATFPRSISRKLCGIGEKEDKECRNGGGELDAILFLRYNCHKSRWMMSDAKFIGKTYVQRASSRKAMPSCHDRHNKLNDSIISHRLGGKPVPYVDAIKVDQNPRILKSGCRIMGSQRLPVHQSEARVAWFGREFRSYCPKIESRFARGANFRRHT
jgi:hypothetical protein